MKNFSDEEINGLLEDVSENRITLEDLVEPLAKMQDEPLFLQDEELEQSKQLSGYTALSLDMLEQFKNLLLAFKYRQDEEKITAHHREKLNRDLQLSQAALKMITDALHLQNDQNSQSILSQLQNSSLLDDLETHYNQQEFNAQLAQLHTELQLTKEENHSFQVQISSIRTVVANLQSELKESKSDKIQSTAPPFNHEQDLHSLAESRLHTEQLERAVHILREKKEESNLEKEQLQRELQAIQDINILLVKQVEDAKSIEGTLNSKIKSEIYEKEGFIGENKSLYAQCEELKAQVSHLQKKSEHLDSGHHEVVQSKQLLDDEKHQLATALEDKNAAYETLIHDVTEIKQNLVRGLREAKELETHYLAAVQEKVEAVSQFSQLQRASDKLRLEIERGKSQCKELLASAQIERQEYERKYLEQENNQNQLRAHLFASEEENSKLKSVLKDLETKISSQFIEIESLQEVRTRIEDELHKFERLAQEKEFMANELLDRLVRVEEDKNHAYEELDACHRSLEDKEQQFDEAQQHLAKKVREVSILDSQIEELNSQIKTTVSSYEAVETLNSELKTRLQKSLDMQVKHEERNHALLKDIENWQRKFSDIELTLQASKKQIEDLQKISDRHQQLQNMVSNFGNILGMPLESSAPPNPSKNVPTFETQVSNKDQHMKSDKHVPAKPETAILPHKEKEAEGLFQNLFDISKKTTTSKNDLFEEL